MTRVKTLELIAAVSASYCIRDLTIEEPEIEGIVRRLYEEGLWGDVAWPLRLSTIHHAHVFACSIGHLMRVMTCPYAEGCCGDGRYDARRTCTPVMNQK